MVINGIVRIIFFSAKSVSCSVVSDSLQPHGLYPTRLLCPRDSPSKNTGVGCHLLLQGIFATQGSNLCLLHWQAGSLLLSHQGSLLDVYVKVVNVDLGVMPAESSHRLGTHTSQF